MNNSIFPYWCAEGCGELRHSGKGASQANGMSEPTNRLHLSLRNSHQGRRSTPITVPQDPQFSKVPKSCRTTTPIPIHPPRGPSPLFTTHLCCIFNSFPCKVYRLTQAYWPTGFQESTFGQSTQEWILDLLVCFFLAHSTSFLILSILSHGRTRGSGSRKVLTRSQYNQTYMNISRSRSIPDLLASLHSAVTRRLRSFPGPSRVTNISDHCPPTSWWSGAHIPIGMGWRCQGYI